MHFKTSKCACIYYKLAVINTSAYVCICMKANVASLLQVPQKCAVKAQVEQHSSIATSASRTPIQVTLPAPTDGTMLSMVTMV